MRNWYTLRWSHNTNNVIVFYFLYQTKLRNFTYEFPIELKLRSKLKCGAS